MESKKLGRSKQVKNRVHASCSELTSELVAKRAHRRLGLDRRRGIGAELRRAEVSWARIFICPNIAEISLSIPETRLLHATFILKENKTPNLATKETVPETRKSQEGSGIKEKERKENGKAGKLWRKESEKQTKDKNGKGKEKWLPREEDYKANKRQTKPKIQQQEAHECQ